MNNATNTKSNAIFGQSTIAILYAVFVMSSILGDILYWLVSKSFAGYAKFFFYPALLIIIIDLLIYKKIIADAFIYRLTVIGSVCLINGLIFNNVGKAFFAHFLPFILPIFAFSYGYRSEFNSGRLIRLLDRFAIPSGIILSALVVIYYQLIKMEYIEYFGAGALIAYPIFYAIKKQYYLTAFIFYLTNIFTGKRSVLLAISVTIFFYIFKKLNNFWRVVIVLFSILTVYSYYLLGTLTKGKLFNSSMDRYFVYFDYISQYDFAKSIDLATSGRLYDVIAAIDRLGTSLINWIIGLGFGAEFTVIYSWTTEPYTTHYSHFTPISYLFLGGILLFLTVYSRLIKELYYALVNINDHLAMMVVYFFIMGFSGAIFFTDVFLWIIIGAFSARRINLKLQNN